MYSTKFAHTLTYRKDLPRKLPELLQCSRDPSRLVAHKHDFKKFYWSADALRVVEAT
jgi:hypothetical protein